MCYSAEVILAHPGSLWWFYQLCSCWKRDEPGVPSLDKLHLHRVFILPTMFYGTVSRELTWNWPLRWILDIRWDDWLIPSSHFLWASCTNGWEHRKAIFERAPERTGGDHWDGRAQLGWRTFMMTCLRWILGYMWLVMWRKIGLSGVFAQHWALLVVRTIIALECDLHVLLYCTGWG